MSIFLLLRRYSVRNPMCVWLTNSTYTRKPKATSSSVCRQTNQNLPDWSNRTFWQRHFHSVDNGTERKWWNRTQSGSQIIFYWNFRPKNLTYAAKWFFLTSGYNFAAQPPSPFVRIVGEPLPQNTPPIHNPTCGSGRVLYVHIYQKVENIYYWDFWIIAKKPILPNFLL